MMTIVAFVSGFLMGAIIVGAIALSVYEKDHGLDYLRDESLNHSDLFN